MQTHILRGYEDRSNTAVKSCETKSDIEAVIAEGLYPYHIQLVRSGVNSRSDLGGFLSSDMKWAELDVWLNPASDSMILRDFSFEKKPPHVNETFFSLEDCLGPLFKYGRGAKINIREGGSVLDLLKKEIDYYNVHDSNLWFSSGIQYITGHNFIDLAQSYPGAILECDVNFLLPVFWESVEKVSGILSLLSSWGINRFSLNWDMTDEKKNFINYLDEKGLNVNISNVADIESLIKVILLHPCSSVSCDFNAAVYDIFDVSMVL